MTRAPHAAGAEPRANALCGDFSAVLAGEAITFDTTLRTVALIEDRCGGLPIVQALEKAVFGRRAADTLALIAGALDGLGRADAEALAGRTAAVEAEAFVLALMAALGFELGRRPPGEGAALPFADPTATAPKPGGDGAASPSAP